MTAIEARPEGRRFTAWADTWRFPVLVFLAALVVLMPVVQISHDHLSPEHPQTAPDISDADRYGGWLQFDTGWYVAYASVRSSRLSAMVCAESPVVSRDTVPIGSMDDDSAIS